MKGSGTAIRSRDSTAHQRSNPFVKEDSPSAPKGIQVTKARRETGLRIWRGFVKFGVGVLIFSGTMNAIVNPLIINPISRALNPPAPAATQLDEASARQVAAATVTDWLTYNPQQLSAYRTVLTSEFTGTGDAVSAWSGSAWMSPDMVLPGAVVRQPGDQLAVAVTARVRIATPAASQQDPPAPLQPGPGDPGNDSTPPAGYTPAGTQWLHLLVPLTNAAGRFTAAAAGPALTDSTTPITTAPGTAGDTQAAADSKAWATSLFTAYAGTDPTALGYLTATELPLAPLAGQVTLASLNTWEVFTAAEGETNRLATAVVTWKLAAADLTVRQTYSVELTKQGQRWFATNITTTTPTTGGTA